MVALLVGLAAALLFAAIGTAFVLVDDRARRQGIAQGVESAEAQVRRAMDRHAQEPRPATAIEMRMNRGPWN